MHKGIFMWNDLREKAFEPVNNAPLVFFRVAFGLLIMLEGIGAIFTGWVYQNTIQPEFTIPFMDFSWLQPLPGYGMYVWFFVMGMAGLFVMIGYHYRLAVLFYLILWAGIYFMQKTSYNNHYYLLVLLLLFMLLLPAHRRFSVDARRNPEAFSYVCPHWCIGIFIVKMAIVYFYAGINKIYPDWLESTTVSLFFSGKEDFWLIGPLLAHEGFQQMVAWGGILFDLLIVPLMLFRSTRLLGLAMLLFFHIFNSAVFHIGIFPYMMIAMAVFFYPPNQIDRWFFKGYGTESLRNNTPSASSWSLQAKNLLLIAFALYFVWQAVLPLRHHFFDSEVNWSEEGHRLSWRMMLRSKSGFGDFYIKDRNDEEARLQYTDFQERLTPKQNRRVAVRPDMTWQVAQRIHEHYKQEEDREVAVYFDGKARLNDRDHQPLIDPDTDLAAVEWHRFKSKDWILPLKE